MKKERSFFGVHLATKGSKRPTQQCSLKYERNIHEKVQYAKHSSKSFAFRPLIVGERVNWQWPIGLAKKYQGTPNWPVYSYLNAPLKVPRDFQGDTAFRSSTDSGLSPFPIVS